MMGGSCFTRGHASHCAIVVSDELPSMKAGESLQTHRSVVPARGLSRMEHLAQGGRPRAYAMVALTSVLRNQPIGAAERHRHANQVVIYPTPGAFQVGLDQ